MTNAFGGFVTTSPLSSHSHCSNTDLLSNILRDHFGPTVQTVADCLILRGAGSSTSNSRGGGMTLTQLLAMVRSRCRRNVPQERIRLVHRLNNGLKHEIEGDEAAVMTETCWKIRKTAGTEERGYVVDASVVRAALIVLIHHSMVRSTGVVNNSSNNSGKHSQVNSKIPFHSYVLDRDRVMCLPRYPRYVEYTRKWYEDHAAAIVEELLVGGRMGTAEVIHKTVEKICTSMDQDVASSMDDEVDDKKNTVSVKQEAVTPENITSITNAQLEEEEEEEQEQEVILTPQEKEELQKKLLKELRTLIDIGLVEAVPCIPLENQSQKDEDEGEAEFESPSKSNTVSGNKRSFSEVNDDENSTSTNKETTATKHTTTNMEDPYLTENPTLTKLLLQDKQNLSYFPPGTVWRANIQMFHDSIRAKSLGRLVSERYNDVVPHSGAIVTAALSFLAKHNHNLLQAQQKQQSKSQEECDPTTMITTNTTFLPDEILPYLPTETHTYFSNKTGGVRSNISSSLLTLSTFTYPAVVIEVEDVRGHPDGGRFEISTNSLVQHLRTRIVNQIIRDRHGHVASRICAILLSKGYLEVDGIADAAMVPAQDARDILHKLYRSKYVHLLNLQQTKRHDPKTAFYLWGISSTKALRSAITQDVCRALCNLRLRRQHEMEVGKAWFERAKESGDTDENENEEDKRAHAMFCSGLERLDNACWQLDETLMVLQDFGY
eukprot:CAMPEP_0184858652 /NCGR_PEP_ID=MMETSP0580-20130426/3740_1 /TAXON_ID=1118495 /ORGANISM="Dactyliosolen fragilissimus" /LENGTH=717 /DNA_ID=CAMNT_0027354921 /DNA_START=130 /DNA_END=2283 /DNA_ORIENTATION=+